MNEIQSLESMLRLDLLRADFTQHPRARSCSTAPSATACRCSRSSSAPPRSRTTASACLISHSHLRSETAIFAAKDAFSHFMVRSIFELALNQVKMHFRILWYHLYWLKALQRAVDFQHERVSQSFQGFEFRCPAREPAHGVWVLLRGSPRLPHDWSALNRSRGPRSLPRGVA